MFRILKSIRSEFLVLSTHTIALPVLKLIRRKRVFPYSMDQLSILPYETVGNELWQVLNQQHLHLLPYYEKHDIKHVVIGFPFTDEGEVCLQFFMLANGRLSFPVIATVLYGVITMPEYYNSFRQAYRDGKMTADLKSVDWFSLMELPLHEVQKKINRRNQLNRCDHD